MSEYGGHLFLGLSASLPEGVLPEALFFRFLCPDAGSDKEGLPRVAPYGLRKVESALLSNGFRDGEVVVAHPERIEGVV